MGVAVPVLACAYWWPPLGTCTYFTGTTGNYICSIPITPSDTWIEYTSLPGFRTSFPACGHICIATSRWPGKYSGCDYLLRLACGITWTCLMLIKWLSHWLSILCPATLPWRPNPIRGHHIYPQGLMGLVMKETWEVLDSIASYPNRRKSGPKHIMAMCYLFISLPVPIPRGCPI